MINQNDTQEAVRAFEKFLGVIKRLREPDGCPWDKVQTPLSMRTPLVEEAFEAVDAISCEDSEHAKEELGDVFLNASMISYMYEQSESFKLSEMINEISEKLIRRHPHVFPQSEGSAEVQEKVTEPDGVLNQWERIKENLEGRKTDCVLDEVPKGFPPVLKAFKFQKKAAKIGFDWKNSADACKKVHEEIEEVQEAEKVLVNCKKSFDSAEKNEPLTENSNQQIDEAQMHVEEEIGDLLFAVINYARKLGVDPNVALNNANQKFYRRFSHVQNRMREENVSGTAENLERIETFWKEAKLMGL